MKVFLRPRSRQVVYGIATMLTLFYARPLRSEDLLHNKVTGSPTVDNGISSFKVNSDRLADPNQIVDNSANNEKNGRDYKAEDAQRQANDGKKGAMAAGAALVAQATPMLMSPFPSVQAAGAALMAKAAQEFMQAGASGSTANKNAAQKDLLRNQYTTGASNTDPSHIAQAIQDPALSSFLGQNGINSDQFYQGIASGDYSTPEAILDAIGAPPSLPPDEMTKAMAEADRITTQTLTTALATMPKIGMDETRNTEVSAGTGSGTSGGIGALGTGADRKGALGSTDELNGAVSGGYGASSGGGGGSRQLASTDPTSGRGQATSFADVMARLGQKPGAAGALSTESQIKLEGMGIARNPSKQNVFQIAHRNYRSYEKWRDLDRLSRR